MFVLAKAAVADPNPWTQAGSSSLIGPMRLNLAFIDQNGTPRAALVTSLPSSALASIPGLQKAAASPLLEWQKGKGGYLDGLWSAMRSSVCSDMQRGIVKLVNHSPNWAYDVQPCAMNSRGYLTAAFQTQWQNEQYQSVNGRRIRFNYVVPLNGVTFWVTSPGTCHRGTSCPFGATDPQYTVAFSAIISVTCTGASGATGPSLGLPAACVPASSITVDGVYGGDVTGNLKAAAVSWVQQLDAEAGSVVVTAGASAAVAAAAAIAGAISVAIKGIGTAIASVNDQHLRDQVSAWIVGFIGSGTVAANAKSASAQFQDLFQQAYFAQLAGLKGFGVGVGAGFGLDFTMGYAPPAKPVVRNITASQNATSLFSPTIALAQPQVQPGETVAVQAESFRGAYVNELDVGWNKTVIGSPSTAVNWGPPNTTTSTNSLTFQAKNLKPGTQYGFRVRECDGITCSPWSETLVTKTEAGGSNEVFFYLDSDSAHPVGAATLSDSSGAAFTTPITIPNSTKPGAHVLNAAVLGKSVATAPLTVCELSGCGPTLSVVNTSNGTLYTTRVVVEKGNGVTLRCSKFAYGGIVTIFVDSATGTKVGTAAVGPAQNCQTTVTVAFAMTSGQHTFVAVEKYQSQTLQASTAVYVESAAQ